MNTQTFTTAAILAANFILSAAAHADNCKLIVVYMPLGDGTNPLSGMYPLIPNRIPFAFQAPSFAECTQEAKKVLMQESYKISSVRYKFTDTDGFRYLGKVKAPKE